MYRVLVTGSRSWLDSGTVWKELRAIALKAGYDQMAVIHGHCRRGADRYADIWAETWRVTCERYPADWSTYRKQAGYVRNAEMVAAGADECLAFIMPCEDPYCQRLRPHGTHGATHCADLAERAGIPVKVTRGGA